MYNSKRYSLPGGNLLEIYPDDQIIRIFEYHQLVGKYYYLISREIINDEVQWLKIDECIISNELMKYISSMVKNIIFL